MRTVISIALIASLASLTSLASIAAAQPAPQPQPPGQPGGYSPGSYAPPPGYPQPGPPGPYSGPYAPPPGYPPPGIPAPYQYQPPTAEEAQLMADGYIGPVAWLGGGFLAVWIGFGTGQAVQGRWRDTGWIFTLGESASLVALIAGAVGTTNNCLNDRTCNGDNSSVTLLVAGAIAFGGLRLWEAIDAFAAPPGYNERIHQLRARYRYPDQDYSMRLSPYINHASSRDGTTTAGLTLRF